MKARFLSLLLFVVPLISAAQTDPDFEKFINSVASVPLSSPDLAQVISSNETSHKATLAIINRANRGNLTIGRDKIFMEYYIWAKDEANQKINEALLNAAARGVEAHITVDAITNLANLDMFEMLSSKSGGRIKIHFYNVPTTSIHNDLMFMTTPCQGADCRERKIKMIEKYQKEQAQSGAQTLGEGSLLSKMLLAGLTSKDQALIRFAGGQSGLIDQAEAAKSGAGEAADPNSREKMFDLGRLIHGALIQNNIVKKVQLKIAALFYGEQIQPILERINTVLPNGKWRDAQANEHWLGITDFTHNKTVALVQELKDGKRKLYIKNGGRNNENSYFLPERFRHYVHKYLFTDVDMLSLITKPEAIDAFVNSFMRAVNFAPMVASLEKVRKYIPSNFIQEKSKLIEAFNEAKARYAEGVTPENVDAISKEALAKFERETVGSQEARIEKEFKLMQEKAAAFNGFQSNGSEEYYPTRNIRLSKVADPNAKVAIVQNEHFVRGLPPGTVWWKRAAQAIGNVLGIKIVSETDVRVFDTVPGKEAASGKGIHAVRYKAMERAALQSKNKSKRVTILIDQGYLYPTSEVVELLGKMIRGEIHSSNVDLIIRTNSLATTDLSGINFLARHQTKAIMELYAEMKRINQPGTIGSIRIFENQVLPNGNKTSVHTKTEIYGDTMMVGSANGEGRSKRRDRNIVQVIYNALAMIERYMDQFKKEVLENKAITKEVTQEYINTPHSEFLKKDPSIAHEMFENKNWAKQLDKRIDSNTSIIQQIALDIYLTTGLILDPRGADQWLARKSDYESPETENSRPSAGGGGGGGGAASCRQLFTKTGSRVANGLKFETIQTRFQQLRRINIRKLMHEFDKKWEAL